MIDTVFMSKILGVYFLILTASYLINPKYGKKAIHQISNSYGFIAYLGSNGVILGLLIIIRHNLWINFTEITVSLFGWIIFVLGAILIFFPKSVQKASKRMQKKHNWIWINIIFLALGVFLTYMGFFKK